MSLALIVYLLVVGGLVAVSASALDTVLRRAALPTRWVWIGAMIALVAFAVAAPRRQQPLSLDSMRVQVTQVTSRTPASKSPSIAAYFRSGQQWADAILGTAFTRLESRVPAQVASLGTALWIASSALVLMLLAGVHGRMSRARRAWDSVEVDGTSVLVAPVAGPAVIGVTRPQIVLPRWLLERDADEQRLVLAHEREHVAARDHLLLIGAWLLAAMMPWHPAVWWMGERLRLAMELDCDARVLRRGVPARRYGLLLIDIAGRYSGHRAGALALADRTSHLERRLKAMTTTRSRFAIVRACALTAVAGLSLLAACEAKLPTSAEVESMDAKSAAQTAMKSAFITKADAPVYVIDGKEATESEANAIPAKRIAMVNIMKGTAGVASKILIATRSDTLGDAPVGLRARVVPDTAVMMPSMKTALRVRGTESRQFDGLVYVNGVLASNDAMKTMNPDRIKSVEVIKGAAAAKISSDPAAMNGIIKITTKIAGEP